LQQLFFLQCSGTPTSLRIPSDNTQGIIYHFKAKHASVQQACFDASSTTVSYFVRDWWLKYQVDILLQSSTATLRGLLTQLRKGG